MSIFDKFKTAVNHGIDFVDRVSGGISQKESEMSQSKARVLKKVEYYITGTVYCMSNIKKLAVSNPDWKSTKAKLIKDGKEDHEIYRFNYINKPVKLIPEPNNKYDPNAVMVVIAGEKVGYITRVDNSQVNRILKKCEIKYISAFISGGEYKYIDNSGELVKDEKPISIKVRIAYVE